MAKLSKRWTLGTLAFGIVVFGTACWRWRPVGNRWTRRPEFLLAGFCFAFLMMQSGLVRSDAPHLLIGLYPMIFLCGAILIGEESSHWQSAILLSIVIAGTAALVWSYPKLLPNNVLGQTRDLVRPLRACPAGYRELDRACFTPGTFELLMTVSACVDQKTKADDAIVVFPYEDVFGATSRRTVAGGVMQGYLVGGDYLTNLDLTGLQKAGPPFGLYFPDGIYSAALDGVPSFTRSPGLWFYLMRHYRLEGSLVSGVLGLTRDDGRDQRLTFGEDEVTNPLGAQIAKQTTTLDLGALRWPSAGADFLKFRIRLKYPVWWKMRKPSALSLRTSFADASEKIIQFVAEPNRDSEVWVYPWDEKEMGGYFSDDESRWRGGNRPAITRLQLLVTPLDWISVVPISVKISSVKAVRVAMTK
ncbi:MAG: hypothetical protein WA655_06990 [Candidatus Korobacteraceae bacterium]